MNKISKIALYCSLLYNLNNADDLFSQTRNPFGFFGSKQQKEQIKSVKVVKASTAKKTKPSVKKQKESYIYEILPIKFEGSIKDTLDNYGADVNANNVYGSFSSKLEATATTFKDGKKTGVNPIKNTYLTAVNFDKIINFFKKTNPKLDAEKLKSDLLKYKPLEEKLFNKILSEGVLTQDEYDSLENGSYMAPYWFIAKSKKGNQLASSGGIFIIEKYPAKEIPKVEAKLDTTKKNLETKVEEVKKEPEKSAEDGLVELVKEFKDYVSTTVDKEYLNKSKADSVENARKKQIEDSLKTAYENKKKEAELEILREKIEQEIAKELGFSAEPRYSVDLGLSYNFVDPELIGGDVRFNFYKLILGIGAGRGKGLKIYPDRITSTPRDTVTGFFGEGIISDTEKSLINYLELEFGRNLGYVSVVGDFGLDSKKLTISKQVQERLRNNKNIVIGGNYDSYSKTTEENVYRIGAGLDLNLKNLKLGARVKLDPKQTKDKYFGVKAFYSF